MLSLLSDCAVGSGLSAADAELDVSAAGAAAAPSVSLSSSEMGRLNEYTYGC